MSRCPQHGELHDRFCGFFRQRKSSRHCLVGRCTPRRECCKIFSSTATKKTECRRSWKSARYDLARALIGLFFRTNIVCQPTNGKELQRSSGLEIGKSVFNPIANMTTRHWEKTRLPKVTMLTRIKIIDNEEVPHLPVPQWGDQGPRFRGTRKRSCRRGNRKNCLHGLSRNNAKSDTGTSRTARESLEEIDGRGVPSELTMRTSLPTSKSSNK